MPSETPRYQGPGRSTSVRPDLSARDSSSRPSSSSGVDARRGVRPERNQPTFAPRQVSLRSSENTNSSDPNISRVYDRKNESQSETSSKSWWKFKKK